MFTILQKIYFFFQCIQCILKKNRGYFFFVDIKNRTYIFYNNKKSDSLWNWIAQRIGSIKNVVISGN